MLGFFFRPKALIPMYGQEREPFAASVVEGLPQGEIGADLPGNNFHGRLEGTSY